MCRWVRRVAMISTRSSMLSWSIRKIWVAVEHRIGQHRRIRHDTPYVSQQKERPCTTDAVQGLSEELDPVPPRTNCLPCPTSTSMCLGSHTVNNRHGQWTGLCRMTGAPRGWCAGQADLVAVSGTN